MKNVDWPLAMTLALVFVVMSVVRWRYFKSRMTRGRNTGMTEGRDDGETGKGTPD
jgi:membrane protein implicated in regulation of membrane protease activity